MQVQFEELEFQNILSFGNSPTNIKIETGVSLIAGSNGQGKSALIDALSFCLYGQPYRKIKIKDLINRKNKKNLKVTCKFKVNNYETYQITRTLNPDSIEILKNGESLDLLSSKKLNQDEIDKIIGINYQLFRLVIALAVNYNKPFLALSAMEKRDIIEQIFNIKIFGLMLKGIKKKTVDEKTKNEINEKTISLLEQNLKSLRKNVIELTEAKNNFQNNKEKDQQELTNKLNESKNILDTLNTELNEITQLIKNSKYDSLILQNLYEKRNNTVKTLNEHEYSIKKCHENIRVLEITTVCPQCSSQLTPEHKTLEINKLYLNINNSKSEVLVQENEKTKIDEEISLQESYKNDLNGNQFKLNSITEKIENLNKEIKFNEEQLTKVLNRILDIDLESINNEFKEKQKEYKITWKESQKIKKTIKNNEVIQNILSENGIKAYFFKKLVPILNQKINEYIRLFELPVIIQFDELMNETITNMDSLKNDIPYFSYSEGEKKRIDMAILLSFIDITKTISNWNCNLLIIDELLDGAMDETGLEKLVHSLKNMTYDIKGLGIYIISHRLQQDYASQFKRCLQITKDKHGFSDIIIN